MSTGGLDDGGTAGVLPAERRAASFVAEEMTNVLDNGAGQTKRRRFIVGMSKGVWPEMAKYGWDRAEYLKQHVRGFIEIHEDFAGSWRPTREELVWMSEYAANSGPLWNTLGPSLLAIRGLASEQQAGWWLDRLLKMRIVVSYAQTELGHGSNVRGLRTLAVYDRQTEEFVLDTPDLLSTKWWPGGMGKLATHVLLYAQLVIDGTHRGLQTFFVQIRDEHHRPLAGVELGDLGAKLGDHATDTGFMRLTAVRIPRQFMLSRHQQVLADGTFVKQPGGGGKLHYVSMLFTRANLIRQAGGALARAVVIAARYSCVRKQGFVEHAASGYDAPERPVIEYSMQRYRICRAVATAYALKFVGRYMLDRFAPMEADGAAGAIEIPANLSELAATSAGLKGVSTAELIEDCRQCCGGNGYLLSSGVAQLWGDYVWWVTAEGDTIVMQMQLAKLLLKASRSESPPDQLSYLAGPEIQLGLVPEGLSDEQLVSYLVGAFTARAQAAVLDARAAVEREGGGLDRSMLELCHTARCHCLLLMLRSLVQLGVQGEPAKAVQPSCRAVLARVAAMYGVSVMCDQNWAGLVCREGHRRLRGYCERLTDQLRPELVALTDAFDIPDHVLNSTIGRSDGVVYPALLESARQSKLNANEPFDGAVAWRASR